MDEGSERALREGEIVRVTEKMFHNSFIGNLTRSNRQLLETQERAGTGKRINRPSDDPVGMARVLNFRASLDKINEFNQNIVRGDSLLALTESSLESVGNLLDRTKQIALAQANATLSGADRMAAAEEVETLFDQLIQIGNATLNGRYIFGGFKSGVPPFSAQGSYQGDGGSAAVQVDAGIEVPLNIRGSDFLATDLDPAVEGATLLTDLNGGGGVAAGSFQMTDRAGNVAIIDLTGLTMVQEVLDAINAAPGINVTASLNPEGTGLLLSDDTPAPTQDLKVEEVGGGRSALDLGILANRPGEISGTDLNPAVSRSTSISALRGGAGFSLGSIEVVNGTQGATLDLSGAQTIGEVLDLLDQAGLNLSAGLNPARTALVVTSTDLTTTAVVKEVNTGTTAADLGLGGGNDILGTLGRLTEALRRNDREAIGNLLDQIEDGLDRTLALRTRVGVRQNQLQETNQRLEGLEMDLTTFLSGVEDADVIEVYSRLSLQKNALEGLVAATSQVTRTSLLDFLR
ncbi:MAG: flagellar hook-associated protein FlgL [Candidatus Tectomicrobia bacterium]|uniref:Flagellar hook-associated protein FlgL n=1 Tax=Tectimicrobiota bacterium TaxID=2528274 RepID=A0A932CMT7_UNCTE|nr:flagellar hook-associated protein FlgL [Candidatus Tectomicrobia bacterium]